MPTKFTVSFLISVGAQWVYALLFATRQDRAFGLWARCALLFGESLFLTIAVTLPAAGLCRLLTKRLRVKAPRIFDLAILFCVVALFWGISSPAFRHKGAPDVKMWLILTLGGWGVVFVPFVMSMAIFEWCAPATEKPPNHVPDPTPPSVTPPADAGGAPSVAADH
jgi:hypothetical protein